MKTWRTMIANSEPLRPIARMTRNSGMIVTIGGTMRSERIVPAMALLPRMSNRARGYAMPTRENRHHRGDDRYLDAVDQRIGEVGAGDDLSEVVEGRREEPLNLSAERLVSRLERRRDHPQHRGDEEEGRDERDDQARGDAEIGAAVAPGRNARVGEHGHERATIFRISELTTRRTRRSRSHE